MGLSYGSILNINTSLTDNDTQYYCTGVVSADSSFERYELVQPANVTADIALYVEAVPNPQVSIFRGIPVSGSPFTLTCTATVPPNVSGLATVSVLWRVNGAIVDNSLIDGVTLSGSGASQSLNFSSINSSVHEDTYSCIATLSIPNVPLETRVITNYTLVTLGNPEVSISAIGSGVAGEVYSLQCTVNIVTGTPNITWLDGEGNQVMEGNGISFDLTTPSATQQIYTLNFNPLNYTHTGYYQCMSNLTVQQDNQLFEGFGSDMTTVYAQIPSPTLSLVPSSGDSLIRGTVNTLTCSVMLTYPSPPTPNVTISISRDGMMVTDGDRLTVNIITDTMKNVSFTPLNTSDTGNYTCTAVVSTQGSGFDVSIEPFITGSTNYTSYTLNVQDIPTPSVTFTANTGVLVGGTLMSSCIVDVLDELYNIEVNVSVVRASDNTVIAYNATNGDTSVMFNIPNIESSAAGEYQCIVNVSQTDIGYVFNDVENRQLNLTIPTPVVTITTDEGTLEGGVHVEGQLLDIVCSININEDIDTPVTVSVVWTRNGTLLTNGAEFTISPVTSVSNIYNSTLRVNGLEHGKDNNALYGCSVDVTSPSPFITGSNDNIASTVLRVADFDANHVQVAVMIPSVPVAGNSVTLTCVVTVPERFTHNISTLTWTYVLLGSPIIDLNADATVGPIEKDGNSFYSNLTLGNVVTSDAREYFCQTAFSELDVLDRTTTLMSVQIPPPSVSITQSPSTGPIYESTNVNLTCTVTVPNVVDTPVTASVVWTDPSGNIIPTNDPRRLIMGPVGSGLQSILVFKPIDDGSGNATNNDTGTFNCQMTLNSTNTLILEGVNSTNTTLTVESLPPLNVSMSSVGSVEAGQSLNITCTVTTVPRLFVPPTITFMKFNDTSMDDITELMIPYTISVDDFGAVTMTTLMLDPVALVDGGMYTCMAEVNITVVVDGMIDNNTATFDFREGSDMLNITVDFPPLIIDIIQERGGALYAGTPYSFLCAITLSPHVTIPVTVTNQWTRNNVNVPMGQSDATISSDLTTGSSLEYNATLSFYPLDNADDSGEYRCNVNLTSTNSYVRNTSGNASTSITVLAIPQPMVTIVTNGNTIPGSMYMLNCTVSLIEHLISSPVITWSKSAVDTAISVPSERENVSSVMTSLYLNFPSLNTSDAGNYTCVAVLSVEQIGMMANNSDSTVLPLQIPPPIVTVTPTRTNYLLAGSTLTINCDITIDPNVDTPFTVYTTWTMDDNDASSGSGMSNEEEPPVVLTNSMSDRINISDPAPLSGYNRYRSQLSFSTLSSTMDSGTYTCNVTIVPTQEYMTYISTSDSMYDSTSITVTDPMIGDFTVSPSSFLGLETSCTDSDPYDNFTLTCMASKSVYVLPDLIVAWYHNGTMMETGVITTNNDRTYITNILEFPNSTQTDSGTYTCRASIVIPESTNIQRMDMSTVTLRATSDPYVPTDINTTVGETSATITFTIPAIAYTPEIYTIDYTGLVLQPNLSTSSPLYSTDNISDVNTVFNIMLTDLEEDSTYNYTVISTNCIGSTSSNVMSFTTLPTLPEAPPTNCMNNSFNSRSINVSWEPLPLSLRNGRSIGYNLTCTSTTGTPVMGLSPTQTFTDTVFNITDVVPFTSYVCTLTYINIVGQSPSTQCTFTTAQDIPSDSPQSFSSFSTITTVTYSWNRPTTPNGIITAYNLTVTNMDTGSVSSYIINVLPDQDTADRRVTGFSSYQNYTATVSASTVIGYGPVAINNGRTQPNTSTAPALYITPVIIGNVTVAMTIPVVNDTTVNVTWTPPSEPNGDIIHYIINITQISTTSNRFIQKTVNYVPGLTTYTELISGLSTGIPYYVSMAAVNNIGEGINVNATVFTKPETPSVAPGNVVTNRGSNGLWMVISWDTITLEQARGFFQYVIILEAVGGGSRKRESADDITTTVPYDQNSVNVTGLNPQLAYRVSAAAGVQNGSSTSPIIGPTDPPITVTSEAATQAPGQDSTIIGIAVGVVLAVILVILVIGAIIFLCWYFKRREGKFSFGSASSGGGRGKKKDLFELVEPSSVGTSGTFGGFRTLEEPPEIINGGGTFDTAPVTTETKQEEEIVKEKPDDHLDEEQMLERMKPIAIASFHEHVQEMHVDSDKGFETEYKSVPMQTESNYDSGKLDANKTKNRFANIFPYDYSRVKLTLLGDSGSDYVNANYVDGYNRKDCYLAAQGPLPSTVSDFWRMIWEFRVNHIVMLTGVVEGGKKKCEQYWPEKIGEAIDVQNGLNVSMTSFVNFADYVIRDFRLAKAESDEKELVVSHYHFTSWPDHGVPQFATSLISFIKRVQKDHNKDKGIPLLVHCSAGVGRTGTFIMLDSMMDRLKNEDSINVYEFLRQMRSKRMYMVQTLAQYVFLHDALDELTTCGDTAIFGSNLRARVNKTHKLIPGKNVTGFQEQFELLDQVGYKPSETAYSDGVQPVNVPKNRYPDIVPLNMHRPRLRPDGSTGSDYINASFVDGYKQRNAYLVAQGPLKHTVDDFWRMMMEFKSRSIVQLCNTIEEGQEKCYMYWPTKEGEPVEYGKIKVTLQSEIVSGDYTIRKLHISNEKGGKNEREGHLVTQFHYTGWPEHGHPTNSGSIIEMIDMITRAQMNTGNKAITVVCNDGVGRSGAFLCIHSQLERLKTEGEVDVFKYLKTARTRRIGLLSELDHYVFCHEVLADYVESFDPYANFKDNM